MPKPYVQLNATDNQAIVIARDHIAFIREREPHSSDIGFASGDVQPVQGTVPELVEKIWPSGG